MLKPATAVLATLVMLLGLGAVMSPAEAIPSLQLDIAGGVYNETTETIVATSDPFTVYAYMIENNKNKISDTYYLSIAVLPAIGPVGGGYGSFLLDGNTVNVTADMVYGTPPVETLQSHEGGDLPTHGIFPTYFKEVEFQFVAGQTSTVYNTQDQTGRGPQGAGPMYWVAFDIDATLLDPTKVLHFDLYNTQAAKKPANELDVTWFAPFSHDAESGENPPVPEPATLLLLGTGLTGAAALRRRFRKSR
jgi:hypothetical protein